MKTILIIIPFFKPNIGGVETRFNDICQWLSHNGYRVKVITYQPITTPGVRGKSHERQENLEIFRLWWPGFDLFHKLKKSILFQTFYTSSGIMVKAFFYLLCHHREIDVIHAVGFNGALVAKILYLFFRKRWVISTHALYNFGEKSFISAFIRWLIKDAQRVICISRDSRKELMAIGIPEHKIIVHITWVDQNIFRVLNKVDCRKALGLDDKFTVFFAGRLRKIKGVLNLIEAAKGLEDINFVLVGEGPLEAEVRNVASEFSNIIYMGKVPNEKLPEYYNAADVFIMPSLYEEPFGRVAIESLSCGRPCICSNLGGIVKHLDESVAKLIYPTVENIRQAILDLYNNKEKLKEMSSRCRGFAEKNFSQNNMATLLKGYGLEENI